MTPSSGSATPLPPRDDHRSPDTTEARVAARLGRLLERKPLTPRRATTLIAAYTLVITIGGGVVAWVADSRDFHSLGAALWWALQTVTTVGYGDVVPRTTGGRVIGAIVMVSGIAFLTVITASVTAAFIEAARRRLGASRASLAPELADEIATRLAAIERRLDELGAPGSPGSDHAPSPSRQDDPSHERRRASH